MGLHLAGLAVTDRDSDLRDMPRFPESSADEENDRKELHDATSPGESVKASSEMLPNPRNIVSITVPIQSDLLKGEVELCYNGKASDSNVYLCREITDDFGEGVICDSLVYDHSKSTTDLQLASSKCVSGENYLQDKVSEESKPSYAMRINGQVCERKPEVVPHRNVSLSKNYILDSDSKLSRDTCFNNYDESFTLRDALKDFATTAAEMSATSEINKNSLDKLRGYGNIISEESSPGPNKKENQDLVQSVSLENVKEKVVASFNVCHVTKPKIPCLVQSKNLINRNKNSMIPCRQIANAQNSKSQHVVSTTANLRPQKSSLASSNNSGILERSNSKDEIKIPKDKSYRSKKNICFLPHSNKTEIREHEDALKPEDQFPGPVDKHLSNSNFIVSIKSSDKDIDFHPELQEISERNHTETSINSHAQLNGSTNINSVATPKFLCGNTCSEKKFNDSPMSKQVFQVTFKNSNSVPIEDQNSTDGLVTEGVIPTHPCFVSDEDKLSSCPDSFRDEDRCETPSVASEVSLSDTYDYDISSPMNIGYPNDRRHSDFALHSSCSSLPPGVIFPLTPGQGEYNKENYSPTGVNSQGKSRIPKKQASSRVSSVSTRPVRPPMWLSKVELTQEIQRLGNLCEVRTKELNLLKMETKHVSVGFDAFAALVKYMVEDLNALSVPTLSSDLQKTLKQLELTKQDLAYYEREVEEIKAHHCQELNDLSNKLFEVYQTEVAELNAKHEEEVTQIKIDHQKQIENLSANFNNASEELKTQQEKMVSSLEKELAKQREEMQLFQEREIKDLEEKHVQNTKVLQEHIEQLQKKCAELKQHSMGMEDAMRNDTDSKLQWVTNRKVDLEKEVESLKTVLEMKNQELHTLRVQTLEMEKQLEELPFAKEKIKMLQARAEDLEALMIEKTNMERKLSTENQQIKDTYEKESKVNRRLSMENEELQWRLRQAEQSIITGSFLEVPEYQKENDDAITSPTKSPAPPVLCRSVFFTFMDKDDSSPHSPRTPYKKITSGFSANYKTSPGKASRSPPAPSPRKAKSHSEPPQPQSFSSTPKKLAKQPRNKLSHRRQRSDSEKCCTTEENDIYLTVTESVSSVSSESSVLEHKETLLEEHKEQIIASLEILREQRSAENDELMVRSMVEKETIRPSNFDDMSRSAEFADPKTYYHMTFPVLKETGITDGDTEDSSKVTSTNSSKDMTPVTMHSITESNCSGKTVETKSIQNKIKISASDSKISESVLNKMTEKSLSEVNLKQAHSNEKMESNDCKNENECRRTM